MYQRGHVFVNKMFGKDSETLKRKYEYQKVYQELLRMAEDKKCSDVNLIKSISEKYESLKTAEIKTLKKELGTYARLAHEYESAVK